MKYPNKTYSIQPWPSESKDLTDPIFKTEVIFNTYNRLKHESQGFRIPLSHAVHVIERLLLEAGYTEVDDAQDVQRYFNELSMRKLKKEIRQ